jgi:hypothetical protein
MGLFFFLFILTDENAHGRSLRSLFPFFLMLQPIALMFTSRISSALASALLFTSALAQSNQTCYFPSGLTGDVGTFEPCNSDPSAVSMCCDYVNGDRCTPEGICLSGSNGYWRDMCTDQTWQAPECVRLCMGMDLQLLSHRVHTK